MNSNDAGRWEDGMAYENLDLPDWAQQRAWQRYLYEGAAILIAVVVIVTLARIVWWILGFGVDLLLRKIG